MSVMILYVGKTMGLTGAFPYCWWCCADLGSGKEYPRQYRRG